MKKYTSICHCERFHYQADFTGLDIEKKFTDHCKKINALWARLFDEETGEPVAKYVTGHGFIWL